MFPRRLHPSLYASFDLYPSSKGAATHIHRMAQTLFRVMGGGLFYVLGGPDLPVYQSEGDVEIFRFYGEIPNLLERALAFGSRLSAILDRQARTLKLCHFRDPWSGVPLLSNKDRTWKTVYEINGLPSIELPLTYPHLAPRTIQKIRDQEAFCWSQADMIVTPSHTIEENLLSLGVDGKRIVVIPNGADIPESASRPKSAPSRYIIYFGALQPWQGLKVLLEAMTRLVDLEELKLVICASGKRSRAKAYRKMADKLDLGEKVLWRFRLPKSELNAWIQHAEISVAPLTDCTRNIEQGCSPLKILESMAAGVPVVASDLPSVREIITDSVDGRLVRPDRPSDLARAIRLLLDYPDKAKEMGEAARAKIKRQFTWERSMGLLSEVYRRLL